MTEYKDCKCSNPDLYQMDGLFMLCLNCNGIKKQSVGAEKPKQPMTAKKQTAVMLLMSKFPSYVVKEYQDEFDKALQMEREQIEEAYGDGYCDRHSDEITINSENNRI